MKNCAVCFHTKPCKTPKRKRNERSTEKCAGQSSIGGAVISHLPLHLLLSITPISTGSPDNPPPFLPEPHNNFSFYFIMGEARGGDILKM